MAFCDQSTYWAARLVAAKAALEAYEAAELALATGGVQSYQLDTGQTSQKVTKFDLPGIQRTIPALMNRVATLEARVSGCGRHTGAPDY